MPPSAPSKTDLGRLLERVRLHQTILVEFARLSAETTDQQRLLDLACQNAARATGVDHAKVMQYRGDKGDLLIVAGRGWKPGTVGHARLGADMLSPPGRAYQTRDTVRLGAVPDDPEFRTSRILNDHGIISLLNAPIAIDGIVWGVIEVDSTRPTPSTRTTSSSSWPLRSFSPSRSATGWPRPSASEMPRRWAGA